MKRIDMIKYLLLILGCLALTGCPQTFSLEIDGIIGDRPIFKLEEGVLLTSVVIESRLPEPENETGYQIHETFWSTNIPGWQDRFTVKGKPVEKYTYGQPIAGFTEDVAPKKLIPGKYYQARAHSSNRGYGVITFKIVKNGDKFEVEEPYSFWSDIFGHSKPGGLIPEDLKKIAEKGDAEAQYQIGLLYYHGDGVWVDLEEAYEWFLKSAKHGHPKAQYRVGGLCLYEFVGADRQTSFNWYFKSAKQGYHNAQLQIGLAYQLGSVVAQSYREAFKWFLEAANQGNAQAMRYLANLYREGKGVPLDYNEAAKWLQKARERLKKAGARAGDYF